MKTTIPTLAFLLAGALALTGCSSDETKTVAAVRRDAKDGNYASVYEKSSEVVESDSLSQAAIDEMQRLHREATERLVGAYSSAVQRAIRENDYQAAVQLYNEAIQAVPETSSDAALNRQIASVYAALGDLTETRAALLRLADATDEGYKSEAEKLLARLDEFDRLSSEIEALTGTVAAVGDAVNFNFVDAPQACGSGPALDSIPEEQREDVTRFVNLVQERDGIRMELQEVPGLPVIEANS